MISYGTKERKGSLGFKEANMSGKAFFHCLFIHGLHCFNTHFTCYKWVKLMKTLCSWFLKLGRLGRLGSSSLMVLLLRLAVAS